MTPFARALVRKSERALKTARLALSSGDFDNAVNRSFYSMFDIARAALLEAGVAEDKLPRTHSGLIDDKVSETVGDSTMEKRDAQIEPVSLEAIRRQARENWLRLRQQKIEGVKGDDVGHDTDREARNDQSHSIDDDLNE
jgi:uncharacterized protein (UPF0332 family)